MYHDPNESAVKTPISFFNDGVSSWQETGNGSIVDDTVNFIDTKALQLRCVATVNSVVVAQKAISPINISGNNIGLLIYFPTLQDIQNCKRILVSLESSPSDYADLFYVDFTDLEQYYTPGQWQPLHDHKRHWAESGTINWAAINKLYISLKAKDGVPCNCTFGHWYHTPPLSKSEILIMSDDAYNSDKLIMEPRLSMYGFAATSFVNGYNVKYGVQDVLTTSQCIDLQDNHDWSICNHSWTHPDLTTLTEEQLYEELKRPIVWQQENGLTGGRLLALPSGKANALVYKVCKELGIEYVRTVAEKYHGIPLVDLTKCRTTYNLGSSRTYPDMVSIIDQIEADKTVAVFLYHRLVTGSATGFQVSKSVFDPTIDYLKSRVDAGGFIAPRSLENHLDKVGKPNNVKYSFNGYDPKDKEIIDKKVNLKQQHQIWLDALAQCAKDVTALKKKLDKGEITLPEFITQRDALKQDAQSQGMNRKVYLNQIHDMKMGFKRKDLTGESAKLFSNTVIESTDFSQSEPYTDFINPNLVNTTFKRCILNNCIIPTGCILENCSNKHYKQQNDLELWEVDKSLKPIRPVNESEFTKYGISTDPENIPATPLDKPIIFTKKIEKKRADEKQLLIDIVGDSQRLDNFINAKKFQGE